jgi:hypothetical protein
MTPTMACHRAAIIFGFGGSRRAFPANVRNHSISLHRIVPRDLTWGVNPGASCSWRCLLRHSQLLKPLTFIAVRRPARRPSPPQVTRRGLGRGGGSGRDPDHREIRGALVVRLPAGRPVPRDGALGPPAALSGRAPSPMRSPASRRSSMNCMAVSWTSPSIPISPATASSTSPICRATRRPRPCG